MLPASGSLLLLLLFSKPNWNLLAERFLYAPACWLSPFCALTRSTPLRDFPFSLLLLSPIPFFYLIPSSTYEDWYSFVCSGYALDLFYFIFSLSLHSLQRERVCVRSLESIDFKQPLQRLPQDRYFFFFCFHFLPLTFFFFRLAREKYLTYPAKLFCLPIDIRRRLDWYC